MLRLQYAFSRSLWSRNLQKKTLPSTNSRERFNEKSVQHLLCKLYDIHSLPDKQQENPTECKLLNLAQANEIKDLLSSLGYLE